MRSYFDILGLGSVLVDELVLLPEYPEADTKIEIINAQKQVGGPVPVALKTLSKLGLRTSFIGKIGTDERSGYIRDKLAESNIEASGLIIQDGAESGFSQIWIDKNGGTRTIAYSNGTLLPVRAKEINFNTVPDCKILHLDGRNHKPARELIRFHKTQGATISVDTGNFRKKTLELVKMADIAIMPKRFPVEMFGELESEELIEKVQNKFKNTKLIVITDGKNGSICSYRGEIYRQKAFSVETFDSTGAGDVHSAGILYGIFNEWQIEKTLEFAAAVAAMKCENPGHSVLPDVKEVQQFIDRKNQRFLWLTTSSHNSNLTGQTSLS